MTERFLQPSASKTSLLLECSYPFGKIVPDDIRDREAANYGSAFHELLAHSVLNDWGSPSMAEIEATASVWGLSTSARDELAPHLADSAGVLRRWLQGANPWHANFLHGSSKIKVEVSFALVGSFAREIPGPTLEEHRYMELASGEIAGTADLVIVPPRGKSRVPLLVLDHKTGQEDFSEPIKHAQLLTLARAAQLAYGAVSRRVVVGVLHARRRGLAAVYADEAAPGLLKAHGEALGRALARIGDGSMRPGPWCTKCAAAPLCPARDADLLNNAEGLLTRLTTNVIDAPSESIVAPRGGALTRAQRLGQLYTVVQQAEKLADATRREIRNEILAGALPELPDGKGYLTVRDETREGLSKASVLRAYGKLAGGVLLEKLRKDGAIETTTSHRLHAEKERGT